MQEIHISMQEGTLLVNLIQISMQKGILPKQFEY